MLAPRPASVVIDASSPVGRRLVGDWEPADAYVLTLAAGWPHTYAPLLEALAEQTPVVVFVQAGAGRRAARRFIDALPAATRAGVTLMPEPVDSPWVRDYGPLQVRDSDGQMHWLDAEYRERPRDDAVPHALAARWSVPVDPLAVSLDGGAIATDGRGHCVSTFDYLHDHRIDLRQSRLADEVLPALGCASLLLVHALLDEDTGHVDMFLQFLDAATVAISSIDPALDPEQAQRLDETARSVEAFAQRRGLPWRVFRIPMGMGLGGDLLPYVNGIQLGDTFLMPTYFQTATRTEDRAADALAAAMPGVTVVRIPAAEMADLGGALHCAVTGIRKG